MIECTRHSVTDGREDNDCEIKRSMPRTSILGATKIKPSTIEFQFEIIDLIIEVKKGNRKNYFDVDSEVDGATRSTGVTFKQVDIGLIEEFSSTHKHVLIKDDSNLRTSTDGYSGSALYQNIAETIKWPSPTNHICTATILLESNDNKKVYPLYEYPCDSIIHFKHKSKRGTPSVSTFLNSSKVGEKNDNNKPVFHVPRDSPFLITLQRLSTYLHLTSTTKSKHHLDLTLLPPGPNPLSVAAAIFIVLLGCITLLDIEERFVFDRAKGLFTKGTKSMIGGRKEKSWKLEVLYRAVTKKEKYLSVSSRFKVTSASSSCVLEIIFSGFNSGGVQRVYIGEGNEGDLKKIEDIVNELLYEFNGDDGVSSAWTEAEAENGGEKNWTSEIPEGGPRMRINVANESGRSENSHPSGGNKSNRNILCVICLSKPPNTLLLKCRHMCVCSQCSELVEVCPLCRGKVEDRVTVRY